MKARNKFLSVLLVVAMCIGFAPAAYAAGNSSDPYADTGSTGTVTASSESAVSNMTAGLGGPVMSVEDAKNSRIEVSSASGLASALEQVTKGGKIVLTSNIELSSTLVITKNVRINLNNNKLVFVGGSGEYAVVIRGADVTVYGGSLTASYNKGDEETASSGYENGIRVENGGSLVMYGIKLSVPGKMFGGSGSLDIRDGKYSSDPAQYIDDDTHVSAYDAESGFYIVSEKPEEDESEGEGNDANTEDEGDNDANTEGEGGDNANTGNEGGDNANTENEGGDNANTENEGGTDANTGNEGGDDANTEGGDDANTEGGDQPQPAPSEVPEVQQPAVVDKAAVEAGGELILTENIEDSLNLSHNLDLDLAGKTITGNITVANSTYVTLKNGTVKGVVKNYGSLTLTDVTVQAPDAMPMSNDNALIAGDGGELTLNGGTTVNGNISLVGGSIDVGDSNVTVYGALKGNGTEGALTLGSFEKISPESLIAEGYELDANNQIMPLAMTDPTSSRPEVYNESGKTRYDHLDSKYSGNHVTYEKNKDEKDKRVDLKFKVIPADANLTAVHVGDWSDDPTGNTPITTYTFEEGILTIKLKSDDTTFNAFEKLTPVYNLITLEFDGDAVSIPLWAYPRVKCEDNIANNSEEDLVFVLSDAPVAVSLSDGSSVASVRSGWLLTENTDYSGTTTVTVKASALGRLTKGTHYVTFWYESDGYNKGVPVSVQIKVDYEGKLFNVTPGSREWDYAGKKDVTFTANQVINQVKFGTDPVELSNFTISSDGKTLTFKYGYLKKLVEEGKMEPNGYLEFTILDEAGAEVKVRIYPLGDGDETREDPKLTAREGTTYTKGTYKDLVFDCNYPITGDIDIGGITLKSGEYSLSADRKTITIKSSFLEKRASGQSYTLTVTTDYGKASIRFNVQGASYGSGSNGPRTGDESNIVLWAVILGLSGAAIVALVPKKKKQS